MSERATDMPIPFVLIPLLACALLVTLSVCSSRRRALRARTERHDLAKRYRTFISLNRSGGVERDDLTCFRDSTESTTPPAGDFGDVRRRIIDQAAHELRLRQLADRTTLGNGTQQALRTALQDSALAFTELERELEAIEATTPAGCSAGRFRLARARRTARPLF